MADRLSEIFEEQLRFQLEFNPVFDTMGDEDRLRWAKENILHAYSEMGELLEELKSWRSWLGRGDKPDVSAMTEEAIDAIKLILNVLLLYKVTVTDFYDAFQQKSEVNTHRFLQHQNLAKLGVLWRRSEVGRSIKMAALDLDGVLAQYPGPWLDFLKKETGIDVADFDLSSGTAMIPRDVYSRLKDRWRREGLDRYIPPVAGAKTLVDALVARGYKVVIISARPADRYKRTYSDSIKWLKDHGFAYDAVIWSPDKEDKIIRDLPMVSFVVEDDPANVEKLRRAGIKVYDVGKGCRVTFDEILEKEN